MMIRPLAPLARALIAFTSSVQPPRCTSTRLSFTAAGKSLIEHPLRTLSAVAGGGIWMRAAGITCAVMSALWLQVICAKSLVAAVPLAKVLPLGSVVWLGDVTTSRVDGVRSDQLFGVAVLAYGTSVGLYPILRSSPTT